MYIYYPVRKEWEMKDGIMKKRKEEWKFTDNTHCIVYHVGEQRTLKTSAVPAIFAYTSNRLSSSFHTFIHELSFTQNHSSIFKHAENAT